MTTLIIEVSPLRQQAKVHSASKSSNSAPALWHSVSTNRPRRTCSYPPPREL